MQTEDAQALLVVFLCHDLLKADESLRRQQLSRLHGAALISHLTTCSASSSAIARLRSGAWRESSAEVPAYSAMKPSGGATYGLPLICPCNYSA
eukprot:7390189-Prymnesium_polylepis.1